MCLIYRLDICLASSLLTGENMDNTTDRNQPRFHPTEASSDVKQQHVT